MKSRLKRRMVTGLAILTTWGVGLGILSGCNQDEAGQGINNGGTGGFPPGAITYAISQIYDSNAASLYFDAQQQATDAVNELAKEVWGDDANVVAVCDMGNGTAGIVGDDGELLSSFVVAVDGDVVGFYNGSKNIKDETIAGAGFSPDDKAKPEQKEEVLQKLQAAKEAIQAEIAAFKDANPQITNIYDTVVDLGDGEFLGGIFGVGAWARAFVWRVDEEGLTKEEIRFFESSDGPFDIDKFTELYLQGVYVTYTSPTPVSLDEPYEYNPVEPNPPEVVGFEEIYNQVFGEGFVVNTDINNILTDLAERVFINTTDVSVIAVGLNDGFTIYSQNVDALGRTRLTEGVYRGGSLEEITEYLSLFQQIENAGGWESYINSFAPSSPIEEGSAAYTQLIKTLQSIKDNIDNTDVISALTRSDFSTRTVINATTEALPASSNVFGEALMEDMGAEGTIIATYVGDMSGRGFDSTGIFGTGYLNAFDITVVYKNGDTISIVTTECLVPWYTNSTNQSQYEEFVKDGGTYKLRNTQSTTIENSIDLYLMVDENDSSLMGVMLQDKHSKEIIDMFLV